MDLFALEQEFWKGKTLENLHLMGYERDKRDDGDEALGGIEEGGSVVRRVRERLGGEKR